MASLFCPGAVAWGDVATWTSGIGTIGTVVTALYLAKRDGRRREKERKEEMALSDFRSSVLLLPAFSHLAAVAEILPERIAKLEHKYTGSMRKAEELLEIETLRGIRGLADAARMISRDLAVPVLSVFAWCDVFEKCLSDGYARTEGFRAGTGVIKVIDTYRMVDEELTPKQLRIAAKSIKGYVDRAIFRMQEIVNMDIALPDELFGDDISVASR